MVWLFGVGSLLGILSWFIGAPAKNWVEGIGNFAIVAGLVGFFSGTSAGRKEFQSKHKDEMK